jgi:hypothetical protein
MYEFTTLALTKSLIPIMEPTQIKAMIWIYINEETFIKKK